MFPPIRDRFFRFEPIPGEDLEEAVSSADLSQLGATGRRDRGVGELLRALGVHTLALVLYALVVIGLIEVSKYDPLAPNPGWSLLGAVVAGWIWFAGGAAWLVRLANLPRWWFQQRQGLVLHTLVFDALLWLGPWLVLLVRWKRARRLIVPHRP
jgi:hypothetical protein